jgi:hypothetical protein
MKGNSDFYSNDDDDDDDDDGDDIISLGLSHAIAQEVSPQLPTTVARVCS